MDKDLCGAKAKSTGEPCRLAAGHGTDHPGEGRCRFHGGRSRKGAESGTFKHGQDSAYFDPSDLVGFDEWEETVGPQLKLERRLLALLYMAEQKVLRGEKILAKAGDALVPVNPDAKFIATVLNKLSLAHDRLVKQREGETIHVKLAQPEIERAFEAVADAVVDTIDDPELARRVGDAITEALKGIGGGEG